MLQLAEGEIIAIPRAGQRYYFIDADGALKEVKSNGVKTAITAVNLTSWHNTARQRALALSTALTAEAFDDFVNSGGFASTLTGGSSAALSTAVGDGGGIVKGATTGAGSGTAYIYAAGNPTLIGNFKSGGNPFFVQARFKAGTFDANGQYTIDVARADTPGGGETAQFGLVGSASTAFVAAQMYDGATFTNHISTVAVDTAAYHDYGIFSDGTTYSFFYDGVLVTTAPASELGGTTRAGLWRLGSSSGNATQRIQLTDKVYAAFVGQ